MIKLKKIFCVLSILLVSTISSIIAEEKSENNAVNLVSKMKTGWNLGNTLDANPNIDHKDCSKIELNKGLDSEISWGAERTTKEMIKTVHDAGFNVIRIPVSWSDHFVDENFKIDKSWMNRVKTIVDWCYEYEMYVILNIHHDNFPDGGNLKSGYGYYPSYKNEFISINFVEKVWKQIAQAFSKYDNHLVFETLNEPRLRGDQHEWNLDNNCSTCKSSVAILNKLNQKAVDTIRSCGGQNKTRLIMIPGYAASPYGAMNPLFVMPKDSANMLALSVHMYQPYAFAMAKNSYGGTSEFTESHKRELYGTFKALNDSFVEKGVPVIIGEYGATNKENLNDRINWFSHFVSESKKYNMCCVLWDNFSPYNSDESERFGFFNRKSLSWWYPEINEAIMEACK